MADAAIYFISHDEAELHMTLGRLAKQGQKAPATIEAVSEVPTPAPAAAAGHQAAASTRRTHSLVNLCSELIAQCTETLEADATGP
jgi:hypothetical protein